MCGVPFDQQYNNITIYNSLSTVSFVQGDLLFNKLEVWSFVSKSVEANKVTGEKVEVRVVEEGGAIWRCERVVRGGENHGNLIGAKKVCLKDKRFWLLLGGDTYENG